ncbi:unnamed protein product, partial [Ectocarpus sp. 12 AP-2014]
TGLAGRGGGGGGGGGGSSRTSAEDSDSQSVLDLSADGGSAGSVGDGLGNGDEDEDSDDLGKDPGTPPPKRHIFQWLQKDLKAKIDELSTKVGRRKHFQYGPDERDILTGYNSEKVVVLANSLDKYWDWQVEIGKHRALRSWDQGTTPEKSVAKGKGGKTSADPERKPHFLVLLVCHVGNDSTFEGFLKLCEPKTRHDVEDPSNSNAAKFYKALARDMLDVDFKDDHGNEISIPVSHSNDKPAAPEELLEILDNIDFDLAKRELNGRVDGDIKRLVSVLPLWMKFIQGETKECVHNQDQSGGWGADEEKEEEEADNEGEGDGEG